MHTRSRGAPCNPNGSPADFERVGNAARKFPWRDAKIQISIDGGLTEWYSAPVRIISRIIIAALLPNTWVLAQQATPSACNFTVAELTLRNTLATKTVAPVYPSEAVNRKLTGLVVADVCVMAGSTTASSINIVSAPDVLLGKSVKAALSQWTFGPLSAQGEPSRLYSYRSKVIYYFVEERDKWTVYSPADSFHVGPRFAVNRQDLSR